MSSALTPHANLWLERDDRVVLSSWRVRLLEAIEETGSISAAAERMQVQYRCAWDKLEEMETGLGLRLVDRQVGGPRGGGARLTACGRDYVARFHQFAQGIETLIERQFHECFTILGQPINAGLPDPEAPC
jgi:molybdate transport system regulatory protein